MVIRVVIPGEAVPQGRPRFTKIGNFVQAYMPKKSKDYRKVVNAAAREAMAGAEPTSEALDVSLVVYKSIPKSWSKVKHQGAINGLIEPSAKPDIDNFIKAIFDGLNGIVFLDDSQIIRVVAEKHYSDEPRTVVVVKELI